MLSPNECLWSRVALLSQQPKTPNLWRDSRIQPAKNKSNNLTRHPLSPYHSIFRFWVCNSYHGCHGPIESAKEARWFARWTSHPDHRQPRGATRSVLPVLGQPQMERHSRPRITQNHIVWCAETSLDLFWIISQKTKKRLLDSSCPSRVSRLWIVRFGAYVPRWQSPSRRPFLTRSRHHVKLRRINYIGPRISM